MIFSADLGCFSPSLVGEQSTEHPARKPLCVYVTAEGVRSRFQRKGPDRLAKPGGGRRGRLITYLSNVILKCVLAPEYKYTSVFLLGLPENQQVLTLFGQQKHDSMCKIFCTFINKNI